MKAWRSVKLRRWSLFVGPRIRGRCWLVVYETTIIFGGHSAVALIADVISRVFTSGLTRWRRSVFMEKHNLLRMR